MYSPSKSGQMASIALQFFTDFKNGSDTPKIINDYSLRVQGIAQNSSPRKVSRSLAQFLLAGKFSVPEAPVFPAPLMHALYVAISFSLSPHLLFLCHTCATLRQLGDTSGWHAIYFADFFISFGWLGVTQKQGSSAPSPPPTLFTYHLQLHHQNSCIFPIRFYNIFLWTHSLRALPQARLHKRGIKEK